MKAEIPYGYGHHNVLMCAGFHGGGRSTCHGDSGGPLLVTKYSSDKDATKSKPFTQNGVVQGSYNLECKGFGDKSAYPVLFNRLEHPEVSDFILRKMDLSGMLSFATFC